jgi:transcription elongation factor GreA
MMQELDHLVNVEQPALAERLHEALEDGDLFENVEYQMAKAHEAFLEDRIRQIKEILCDPIIVEENHASNGRVGLGSRVTVIEEGQNEPETFVIVGTIESDPTLGRISNESPLGRALMARTIGERVTVQAPSQDIVFGIVAVE